MQKINYKGSTPPRLPIFFVTQNTNNQFQPWHCKQFEEFSQTGVELLYPYEDVIVDKHCSKPFKHLSDNFYQLEIDTLLETKENYSLLVMPHYTYYTDLEWSTPLPVACMWQTDWWPSPLSILFRYGIKPSVFQKGKPFAQAMVYKRDELSLLEMTTTEKQEELKKNEYNVKKWITVDGVELDNLYNVMFHLNKKGKLIKEKRKKFHVFRSSKC